MSRKVKQDAQDLPAGFKSANVEGNFGEIHDFNKAPVLQGECIGVQKVKTKNGPTTIMTVRKEDGILAGVWHSYMLDELFEQNPKGKTVFIRLNGYQKVKGRKEPMKLFSCGVK
jgi:hypothetical protein